MYWNGKNNSVQRKRVLRQFQISLTQRLCMPSNKAVEWLLKVHIIIGNLKSVLNGIYHCVSSKYLQQYLYECCYRYPEIL